MERTREQRWADRADWPLTLSAVAFLTAYAWPILRPGTGGTGRAVCDAVTVLTWAVFALDYLVRLGLAVERRRFVAGHVLDLVVLVLPLLRPLRVLRLVTLLSVLNRYAGGSLRGRVAVYVTGATTLVLFVASLAVLEAERGQEGATITSFPDAVWWAATTVTTVGYGDRYPVTGTGRAVAVGLVLAGIALLGIVTAALASWLLDRVREVEHESQAATRRDVAVLAEEMRSLRAELAATRAPGAG